ncbi:NAD(P)-binding Rossmann-fold containing protein [Phytophthora megakarya]|uniref:NAD(P)-binding Rossmann-fold containing protein n=1 Tax=Phytophthora megakarya TaxID=4795 RepID=A0A225W3K4_9STRA|nr:NAD(P)-binding Rossmann-fold containing protein [Phytophthora megakarya]
MSSHVAFRHGERTSHHNLRVVSEPKPTITPNEVLVQIRGVALNFRDVAVADSTYPFPVKDSVVPCSDGAGVVVEVGSAVGDFKLGDKVITNFDVTNLYGPQLDWVHSLGGALDGVLRQYVALPAHVLTKMPEDSSLSFVQMASLVCTGVTAWNALYGNLPLKPGQTVLFLGTGGVSITGLQLAKAAGATTIITSSSDEKLKFVQEHFGPDHVINYRKTPDWAVEVNRLTNGHVNRLTNGHGADFVIENGGSGTIKSSIQACARGGIVAVIGFLSQAKQEDMPDVASLALAQGCIVRGIVVGSQQLLRELVNFVTAKKIQPYVHKTFSFERQSVLEAFDYLKSGRHIGKIGIVIEDNTP